MCRVFTFHHLCGHVHSNHTLPCPSPTPFTSSPPACHSLSRPNSDNKILSPSPSCADTTQEPHLYPTLCDTCKQVGIVSDWLAKEPSRRFEAIMEWRRLNEREAGSKKALSTTTDQATAVEYTGYGGNDARELLEEMPFIQLNDLQSSSSEEESGTDSSASTPTTVIHAPSQKPSVTSSLTPTIKLTAASRPRKPLAISTKCANKALPEDHQAAIQVNSNASATKPESSPLGHVISAPAEKAAAATQQGNGTITDSTTKSTTATTKHTTPTDAKLSTTIQQTQALVARMAALNKSMQDRSRLRIPLPATTSASISISTSAVTHPKAEAKAEVKPKTITNKPRPRLPLPRPVGVGVAKAKAEATAENEA